MPKYNINYIAIIILLFPALCLKAQDIEQVAKSPILTTNGGISFNQIGKYSPQTSNNDPYSYYLSGNINANLFGVVNLPFSFAFTNNKFTSNLPQPFNRFSISPSYKWVTTHIGYTSMNFSPYTLAGHDFLGGGVELSPGKSIKVSAMYGRLKRSVDPDTIGTEPSFRRMGGGFKIDYMNKNIDVSFNIFKAKDDVNSITFRTKDSIFIKPQDNLTGSMKVNIKLIKNLSVVTEYAASFLNHDISNNQSSNFFIEKDGDMSYYYALKSSIVQTSKLGQIGASYERVSPNYKTLGAYYFNNDFENITANFTTTIKKRINLAMDIGYQRDNLEQQKLNTSSRMIYSGNLNAKITKRLNAGVNVSNLKSFVHITDIYDRLTQTNKFQNLDTLNFTRLDLTISSHTNYIIEASKRRRQNINMTFTYQKASEQQGDDKSYTGSEIYNTSLSYLFSMIPQRLNISTTLNYNRNQMPKTTMNVGSVNLSVQKAFFGSLKTALTATYSKSANTEETIADIVNLRLTGGYNVNKKHTINLSLAMVNNTGIQGTRTMYSANLAYNYIFSIQVKPKEVKFDF
ncbi:MAG: hypothetical protein N4A72_06315 [Bacteroidales bacterium]|jgi:hypothetical protein|nr:hypothetical protein [Bacteroidales bacterium]